MKREYQIWFVASVICFALLAVSFLLMPLDTDVLPENPGAWNVAMGSWFWLALILGCGSQIILQRLCKKDLTDVERENWRRCRAGIFLFFQNRRAKIADVVFGVSLPCLFLGLAFPETTGYGSYVIFSICVFSFCMHCILNGKAYSYITVNKETRVQTKEE